MKLNIYCVVALSLLCLLQTATSSKILVIYPFTSKSHKNFATPIVNELAKRGHEVVFVSGYKDTPVPGVTQIITKTNLESMSGVQDGLFEVKEKGIVSIFGPLMNIASITEEIFNRTFSTMEIEDLIKSDTKFDLVLVSGFMNEFTYGWIHSLKAPIVMLFAGPPFPWILDMMGNPLSLSHLASVFLDIGNDGWSFFRKSANAGFMLTFSSLRDSLFVPMVDRMTREKFPDSPGIKEIERNISLVLTNSHFSTFGPRPLVPSIVEVGGVHCKPAQPLLKDLADFVEGSGEHGFILFSFGSVVKASVMPDKYKNIFLEVFSKLPQRVLWKWETEEMDNLPSNVKLSKWLPQQDLLGHPKIRAFITHGGGLSTMEATYHGVPLIGIPFFGDQEMNMREAERSGFAIQVDLLSLTADRLLDSLNRIMTDPKYKTKVSQLSVHFRDQPDSPLDRAVYWIEYVIRHNGAPHLKPDAVNYHWLQNLIVDVLVFLILLLAVFMIVLFLILRLVVKLFFKAVFRGKRGEERKKKIQ